MDWIPRCRLEPPTSRLHRGCRRHRGQGRLGSSVEVRDITYSSNGMSRRWEREPNPAPLGSGKSGGSTTPGRPGGGARPTRGVRNRGRALGHAESPACRGDHRGAGAACLGDPAVGQMRGATHLELDQAGALRLGADIARGALRHCGLRRVGRPLATTGKAELTLSATFPALWERDLAAVDAADRHAAAAADPPPSRHLGAHRPVLALGRRGRERPPVRAANEVILCAPYWA